MKRLLALVLSCFLLVSLFLSPAKAVSPYALGNIRYDGKAVSGKVTVNPDASTLPSHELCVRCAFFMDNGSYCYVFTDLYPDSSFSVDFIGPVSYIVITLFEEGVDWLEGGHALDISEIFIG